jgi:glutathione-regulated potassium-efflux system ancillary protein KefG
MKKILIIFAHPVLEKSRVHKTLLKYISGLDHVTFVDLYESYPDFDIDVKREQQLLLAHDIIIWQHPLCWNTAVHTEKMATS